MATETKRISCAAGAYTLLAAGKANVTARPVPQGRGRIVVGSSLPSPNEPEFIVANHLWPVEFGELTATDNVYFMPDGSDPVTVEVIRG